MNGSKLSSGPGEVRMCQMRMPICIPSCLCSTATLNLPTCEYSFAMSYLVHQVKADVRRMRGHSPRDNGRHRHRQVVPVCGEFRRTQRQLCPPPSSGRRGGRVDPGRPAARREPEFQGRQPEHEPQRREREPEHEHEPDVAVESPESAAGSRPRGHGRTQTLTAERGVQCGAPRSEMTTDLSGHQGTTTQTLGINAIL